MPPSKKTEVDVRDNDSTCSTLAVSEPSVSSQRESPVLFIVGPRPDVQGYSEQVKEADQRLSETYKHYRQAGTVTEGTDPDDICQKLAELVKASSEKITVLVSVNGETNNSIHKLFLSPSTKISTWSLMESMGKHLPGKEGTSKPKRRADFFFLASVEACDDDLLPEHLPWGSTASFFANEAAAQAVNLGSFAELASRGDLSEQSLSAALEAELSSFPEHMKLNRMRRVDGGVTWVTHHLAGPENPPKSRRSRVGDVVSGLLARMRYYSST